MKTLILTLLLIPSVCFGWGTVGLQDSGIESIGGGPTYLLELDFEETGTPTEVNIIQNTPDFDDSTSPSPLSGSLSNQTDDSTGNESWEAPFSAGAERWCAFEYSIDDKTPAVTSTVFSIRDASDAIVMSLQHRTNGDMRVIATGPVVVATITDPLTDATKHYFQVHINRIDGAGSDVVEVWEGATGTWGSADVSSSAQSLSGNPENVFMSGVAVPVNIDLIRCDDEAIADY